MKQLILILLSSFLFATIAVAQPLSSNEKVNAATSSTARFNAALAKEESGQTTAENIGTSDGMQLAGKLFQVVLWTLITCLLAYMILGKMLPKLLQMTPAGQVGLTATAPKGLIKLLDRLPLDAKRSLFIVKVEEEFFLVGVTEQSMQMLAKLDLSEASELHSATGSQPFAGLSRFASLLGNKSEKDTPS